MCAADATGCNEPTRKAMVHGCVGKAAASVFLTWVKEQNLPDPEAILANPSSLRLPVRFDVARAICGSIVGAVQSQPTVERWEASQDVIETVYPQHAELGVTLFARLNTHKPDGHIPNTRNGVFSEIHRVMTAVAN